MSLLFLLLACTPDPWKPVDPAVALMADLDTDRSGELTADELYSTTPESTLHVLDTDKSGGLSIEEVREAMSPWKKRSLKPGKDQKIPSVDPGTSRQE